MNSVKQLRSRWEQPRWRNVAKHINDALNSRSPNAFEDDLKGLPLAEEVGGWLDLRGALLTGGAMNQQWLAIDFSYGVTEIWRPLPGGEQQLDGPFTAAGCTFDRCRFQRTKVNVADANLRRTMIKNSTFVDCVFAGAHVGNAMFIDSDVPGSDFRGIKTNDATGFAALFTHDAALACYGSAVRII